MEKICNQTTVIEVDNSIPKCEKLLSTDCIILEEAKTYLSLPEGSTLTEVIDALFLSLIDARNRIATLEQ